MELPKRLALLGLVSILVVGMFAVPPVRGNGVVVVTSITRNGTDITSVCTVASGCRTESSGTDLYSYTFEIPYGGPTYRTSSETYVLTLSFPAGITPYVVGAMGSGLSWTWTPGSPGTLTITVNSILQKSISPAFDFYLTSIQVITDPTVSIAFGMYVSFNADQFSMAFVLGTGPIPGTFLVTLTGNDWRTGTTGNVNIFIPASAPANFGATLNDVVITLDGAGVSAETSSSSNAGQPGRLWSFTITFSTHTVGAYLNPAAIPDFPLGLPILAFFMLLSYGLIRRRKIQTK